MAKEDDGEKGKKKPHRRWTNTSHKLLEDENVSRWYHNTSRGAEVTADTYLRRLNAFLGWAERSPMELVNMEEGDIHNLLLDFVTHEEKRGMAGSYIMSTIKAIKSWLGHNGVFMRRKVKITGAYQTPTLQDERTPTREELREIFLQATPRDRVSCALIAHAGVRPEVIGNYKGTDGLRLKDLPDLRIEKGRVIFDRIPAMVVVRPELSKTGKRYFSFIGQEAADYIRSYLEDRIRSGEELGPETDLVSPKWASKKFIRSLNISDGIRLSIRKAGYDWRPYVLRGYFSTRLMMAEARGQMIFSFREFLMGHNSSISATYSINKKLNEDVLDNIRDAYGSSLQFLETNGVEELLPEERRYGFRTELMQLVGMSEKEMSDMNLKSISDREVLEEFVSRLFPVTNGSPVKQKVVTMNELGDYMERGWQFEHQLSPDRVIIKHI